MSIIEDPLNSKDPSIRKAKFIFPNERIYTLDFDHNIQMQELKLMIQKAAHLRKNTFKLFSNGDEYSQYNEEIFDSLFPNQSLVVFTLEYELAEEKFDETELLLQMNSPCPEHKEKFLLYYCFTCGTSICSECFMNGQHKNHSIQDKCFYLLPSKYLVDKIFEKWSSKPYEDYQISVDLSELKAKVNNVMFDELFKLLKKVQEKCNSLIDEYNSVNISSLGNIRDSVRDIKVSCIKALDNLKEELHIKDIVNNQQIFVEFDSAYKELGKLQNSKFEQNLKVFQELNNQISPLVSNLVQQIYKLIHKTLNVCLNEKQFHDIKEQINQKFIKPADKDEIINRMSEHKRKRQSFINMQNLPKTSLNITSPQERMNSDQGKSITTIQNNINVKPFMNKDNTIITQNQNKTMINDNSNRANFGYINNSIGQTNITYVPLTKEAKFGVVNNNNSFPNTENKIGYINSEKYTSTMSENKLDNINSNLNSNYGGQIKIQTSSVGPFATAQAPRQIISPNLIPKINITENLSLNSASNNRDNTSFNNINSNLSNNLSALNNTNNNNMSSNNNPFGINLNNINNYTTTSSTTHIIPNLNNNQNKLNKENIINGKTTDNFIDAMVKSINKNINSNNSDIQQKTIISYKTDFDPNNYVRYINKQIIPEETESETEICRPTDVRRFLKTEYLLAPVPQTFSIKIITSDNRDERTVPLKFPENYRFNTFLLDCAHCNCTQNKCLYVCGGIEPTSEKKRSNVLLCIDITKLDELKVVKKASMNFARCAHTMINDNKYIYVVGGEDLDSVERYDIENDIWEIMPNTISKRMYPILYINNGYLYAFFGKYKSGEYPCSVERLNISGNSGIGKPSWEIVLFSNRKNIDLSYYGCGLHEIKGLLYFFGGKCKEQNTNKIFFYNFENKFFEEEDSTVLWKDYFRENRFYPLGDRLVQCSESKYFGVYMKLQEE